MIQGLPRVTDAGLGALKDLKQLRQLNVAGTKVTPAGVAALLSDLTGRSITRVVLDDAEWAAGLVARGVPAPTADFSLGIFRAARRGEFAATDPALEQLIGRPATPLRDVLAAVVAGG